MSTASGEDHGVDIVKNEDDVSQEPPTEGEPQDEESPSTKDSSSGYVAPGQKKEEGIAVVALSEKKDAPLPLGQSVGTGKQQPLPDVGEAHGSITPAAEGPVVNAPHVNTHHAADQVIATSSKVNNPRKFLSSDGKLAAEARRPQVTETNFPMKLYDMLLNPDNQHAISWMPHGRAWKVRQKDVFMRSICPQYFSQTKFESFIRQANGWGFRRIRRDGPDRNAYYHELFLRGKPELLESMRRPLPGEKASQEVMDPDFYNMAAMPLLTLSKQVSFASPSNSEGKKKKRKTDSNRVQSSSESAFSNPYGGHEPDPHWHGMPPPPPSPWGAPYAYSQPPDFGGYGMPPPPPPPPPPESAAAGWPHQPPSPHQEPGTNMPSNGMPPFDPSFYFPPPYYHQYSSPSQMNQDPSQDLSQYQANDGANHESNMNRPPAPDGQTMPPPLTDFYKPQYQYPPYPPPPPPPHQYPGNMPYYPPPGDMPYYPAEAGPGPVNPDNSSESYHSYQFGSVPPHPVPTHPFPQGNGNERSDLNYERNDSFHFSPIQHHYEDES